MKRNVTQCSFSIVLEDYWSEHVHFIVIRTGRESRDVVVYDLANSEGLYFWLKFALFLVVLFLSIFKRRVAVWRSYSLKTAAGVESAPEYPSMHESIFREFMKQMVHHELVTQISKLVERTVHYSAKLPGELAHVLAATVPIEEFLHKSIHEIAHYCFSLVKKSAW